MITNGPDNSELTFVFAHGAGAGMDHEFMSDVAEQLAAKGVRVIRFEFPYMQKRREDGKKRPPDRADKLILAFKEILQQLELKGQVYIGGKSMGGRMASLLAMEENVDTPLAGVICLGFPFHPPGKPEKFKGDHLAQIGLPTLIIQGERDTFGNASELEAFSFSEQVQWQTLEDGDHSFKPRKRSGFSQQQHIQSAVEAMFQFMAY
ncbi:MAG: dienelactone hydrolase family protein [Motiliproteus sp.]|nr:dienelactone hydrolase family protein [Motiliproteus sp.]MCW9053068.1 dienelactone hydrolase family protein [Motiliproteus sp.]